MTKPLVTVFIPVYNAEKYIFDSLNSIVNQTYKNIEILIVDDGSTDNSISIIKKFNDFRIRTIINSSNKGIPFSRNVGLAEAKGDYLVVMDADDISLKERIEIQVKFMENNKQIVASGTDYNYLGKVINKKVRNRYRSAEGIKIRLMFSSPIANPTSIIRLETIHKYNLSYNNNYFVVQDYDMWFQLSKYGELSILPKTLLNYRVGHPNISSISRKNKFKARKKIVDQIHNKVLEYYNFKLNKQELETYNNFFSDNHFIEKDINTVKIYKLITKLLEENHEKAIFNQEKFNEALCYFTVIAISNCELKLNEKIKLYIDISKMTKNRVRLRTFLYLFFKNIKMRVLKS